MRKIIELDQEDIKELISEKYGVKPKDIEWECEANSSFDEDDGFVVFKFEEKR